MTSWTGANGSSRYSYMNAEYKVQPRMGISSSNFHLAVNTDELDDEVFTDNSDEVFLDPRHVYEDDVFLDTPENHRRKLRSVSSFKRQQKSSLGSQHSSTSMPPACYLQRKALCSSDRSQGSGGAGSARSRLQSANSANRSKASDSKLSDSSSMSSMESLRLGRPPASPPNISPPPPPPPRPPLDKARLARTPTPKFDYPSSPKPEVPPRCRLPPLPNQRRAPTPVSIPVVPRAPLPAPRSYSSQDLRLPTSNTLLCDKSSSEDEVDTTTPLRARTDSEGSDTYLHLCESHWPI